MQLGGFLQSPTRHRTTIRHHVTFGLVPACQHASSHPSLYLGSLASLLGLSEAQHTAVSLTISAWVVQAALCFLPRSDPCTPSLAFFESDVSGGVLPFPALGLQYCCCKFERCVAHLRDVSSHYAPFAPRFAPACHVAGTPGHCGISFQTPDALGSVEGFWLGLGPEQRKDRHDGRVDVV